MMMKWLHVPVGPKDKPNFDRDVMATYKGEVRRGLESWRWKHRWLAKRDKIPALRELQGDSSMTIKQEIFLQKWTWLYSNSKGFRQMLITQAIQAQVNRLTECCL